MSTKFGITDSAVVERGLVDVGWVVCFIQRTFFIKSDQSFFVPYKNTNLLCGFFLNQSINFLPALRCLSLSDVVCSETEGAI